MFCSQELRAKMQQYKDPSCQPQMEPFGGFFAIDRPKYPDQDGQGDQVGKYRKIQDSIAVSTTEYDRIQKELLIKMPRQQSLFVRTTLNFPIVNESVPRKL